MSTEKKKKLTLKQTKFIKYYFETSGNGLQSARLAGYKGNDTTLGSVASENLTKPDIQEAIAKLYKTNDLTDERLLKKHSELLDCPKNPNIQFGALKLAYEVKGKLVKTVEIIELTKKERDAKLSRLKNLLS